MQRIQGSNSGSYLRFFSRQTLERFLQLMWFLPGITLDATKYIFLIWFLIFLVKHLGTIGTYSLLALNNTLDPKPSDLSIANNDRSMSVLALQVLLVAGTVKPNTNNSNK